MPKFRTSYDFLELYSEPGNAFEPIYSARYDDSGVLILEKVGERDIFAEIQSHAESVDINNILLRYSRGETDVLSRVQGFYEDVSDMPKTYQDVLNSVLLCEEFFTSLPVEEKEKFDNSFSKFMIELGNPDFMEKFNDGSSPVVPDSDSIKVGDNDES